MEPRWVFQSKRGCCSGVDELGNFRILNEYAHQRRPLMIPDRVSARRDR